MRHTYKIFLILLTLATATGAALWAGTNTETQLVESHAKNQILLTLEQAINLALQANRGIISSADAVELRELSLKAAESEFEVKFVPSVDTFVSNSDDDSDSESNVRIEGAVEKKFELGPTGTIAPRVAKSDAGEYTTGIGVSLNIPLFHGLGREVNLDAFDTASFSLRESRYSHYLTKDRTVLDTVAAVYTVIKQKELLNLFAAQVARYKGHADTARVKEKAGLATPIDVYRAEISLKDAEDNLSRTQKALADAKDRLKLILTVPLEISIQVTAPIEYEPVLLNQKKALDIALDNRVELKRAGERVDESLRKSRIAKHDLLPEFNLLMDYERAGTSEDFRRSTDLEEDIWSVSLTGRSSWPRSVEKATFQQRLLSVKTARLNQDLTRDEIEREVRAQLEALKESENSIIIREEQIKTAEGKLALSQIKFRYAMANNFDVIESENELERAKVDLLTARTDYIVGIYKLRSVLGTLIQ
jgi:outer membrane protein TolC